MGVQCPSEGEKSNNVSDFDGLNKEVLATGTEIEDLSYYQFTEKKFADLPEIQILPESVRTHPATVEVELTQSEGETIQSNLDIEL